MEKLAGFLYTSGSWWIFVLGAKYLTPTHQSLLFGAFVVLSVILHHLYFKVLTKKNIIFWITFSLIGITGDAIFLAFDILKGPSESFFPLWLLGLWLVFPLNFFHSLEKFTERKWLGILFGAIGGPLAYSAGPAFGILGLSEFFYLYIGAFWAIYMALASIVLSKFKSSTKTI